MPQRNGLITKKNNEKKPKKPISEILLNSYFRNINFFVIKP